MARLFVAVWPPTDVRDALAALPRPTLPGVRWMPLENLHVTLRFLGHADADLVADRLRTASLPRVAAVVGPATTSLGDRVVMAPVDGLEGLAAAVAEATRDLGEPPSPRPFVGHVTLARTRRRPDAALLGVEVRGRFEVEAVALVSSVTRADGAHYTTVATFPTD